MTKGSCQYYFPYEVFRTVKVRHPCRLKHRRTRNETSRRPDAQCLTGWPHQQQPGLLAHHPTPISRMHGGLPFHPNIFRVTYIQQPSRMDVIPIPPPIVPSRTSEDKYVSCRVRSSMYVLHLPREGFLGAVNAASSRRLIRPATSNRVILTPDDTMLSLSVLRRAGSRSLSFRRFRKLLDQMF